MVTTNDCDPTSVLPNLNVAVALPGALICA
jgi:hypothetical protein